METYIATLYAKKGHEDEVAAFYSGLTRDVEGLEERTVFRASDGRFAALVREKLPPGADGPPHGHGPQGTHFIVLERWRSADDRIAYSMQPETRAENMKVIPHLLPEHTHELYDQV